jgi:iron complex transport system substrate-binding protein
VALGWAISLATGFLMLAAGPAEAAVSAQDDLGTVVALPRPARRVVALAPNVVEILFAAGAGPELKGVSAEATFPAAARKLPRVGSFSNPDEEAILALKPDLAVMAHGNPRAFIDRLRSRRIPVFVCHPKKVADVLSAMRGLAVLTGHTARGLSAAGSFQRRLDAVRARVGRQPPVRAAVMVWDDPITVAGSGAFLHDALRLAGGTNVAADLRQPYPTLDPEQFAVRNPEAIVFALHDAERVKRAAARPGIRSTAAARSHRVFAVHEDLILRPGPRLIEGIERMARGLHPGAFRQRARFTPPS